MLHDVKLKQFELAAYWDKKLKTLCKDGSDEISTDYTKEVTCALCGEVERQSSRKIGLFYFHRCKHCASLYVSPRLKDSILSDIYSGEYYRLLYETALLPAFNSRVESIGINKYSDAVKYYLHDGPGIHLDIGAGVGEVSECFKDHGWKTHLLELNPLGYQWLCRRGHDSVHMLTLRSFLEKNFHGNHFDIISAFGVIEHVTNPVEFLADAVSLLSPGGVFISEVPSGDGFLSQYCMDTGYLPKRIMIGEQHLVLPSIAAYISLHQSHGLELLELKTNGLDLETLFYENHLKKSDLLSKAQAALDDGGLGDLVRGIWRKVK